MSKTLLCIVGPTAIGKTALGIALATHYDTEILSADSRQFYKEMRIGTAVPSVAELTAVKHHFIQHKSIFENYTVGDFEREAIGLLEQLFKRKDVIIMVGGSGLYIDAVTKGLDNFPKVDSTIRASLNTQFEEGGIKVLQEQLAELDPKQYQVIDQDNPQRLIRALEVCIGSGKPYSSFLKKAKKKRPFKTITIGISAERALIYERINSRVDIMMDSGLLKEVESLMPYKKLNALQTVGYKELFAFLDQQITLEEAVEEIKKNTRRFAKRQGTWFKRNQATQWISHDQEIESIVNQIAL